MGFFITLIIWAVTTLVSELVRPKPKYEDARPAGLGDFRFPTATEGRAVPIVWGTVRLKAPNVIWYGNLKQVPITDDVRTGLFSSDTVTTGYLYYVGIQFALCRGPIDAITAVHINDKIADAGRVGAGSMFIDAPDILGGIDLGQGGVQSDYGELYVGDYTQTADSYLSGQLSPAVVPGFRGTAYFMFHGYVGTSSNLVPWSFDIKRIPDGLNLASAQPGDELIDSSECNPMNVLYEIMTDPSFNLNIPAGDINVPNFRAAAATLASEGNGISFVLDSGREASDVINEVLRQIDGVLYFDRENGDWRITLVRDDYTLSAQPLYDESNIISLADYSRTTWTETSNCIRLLFEDTDDNFKQSYALAQDMANEQIQGGVVATEVKYPGCKKRSLANRLVWRELSTIAYPLAKHTIIVDRNGFNLRPGSVFRWSWDRLGISELAMRVTRISYGTLGDNKIRLSAVQDIFATPGPGTFGDPGPTGWGGPEDDPVAGDAADVLVFEAPRQMVVRDTYAPNQVIRVFAGARDPGGGTVGFSVSDEFGTARPLSGTFSQDFTIDGFTLAGELDADIGAYGSGATRPTTTYDIVVNDLDDLSTLRYIRLGYAQASSLVSQLLNIVYIDGEFIGYERVDHSGGAATLSRLYRGLFHTAPKAHAAGTRVWFMAEGGNLNKRALGDDEDEVDLKLRSRNAYELISEASTPTVSLSLNPDRIWSVPLAPRDPILNSVYADTTDVSVDEDYATELGISTDDDGLGVMVEVSPRAWRVDDVIDDAIVTLPSAAWLDDSPNFDFELVLDPSGTPATTAAVNVAGSSTPLDPAYITRNAIIVAMGSNRTFPTDARLDVTAKHTPAEVGSEVTNPIKMQHEFTIASSLQGADDLTFGGIPVSTISDGITFGETGNYSFDIKKALPSSGILEGRVNGGSFVTIVSASGTSGLLTVTAGDTVELRFTQAPTTDQFFDITGPSSELGYGVLLA